MSFDICKQNNRTLNRDNRNCKYLTILLNTTKTRYKMRSFEMLCNYSYAFLLDAGMRELTEKNATFYTQ